MSIDPDFPVGGTTPPSPFVQPEPANRLLVRLATIPEAPLPSPALRPQDALRELSLWVNEGPADEIPARQTAARIVHTAGDSDSVSPVNLSRMGLSSLPPMPPWIRDINASGNRLTVLPRSLPPALTQLNAMNNRIDRVPPRLLEEISQATIALEGNPLVEGVQLEVEHAQRAPDYRGPRFAFSAPVAPAEDPGIEQRPGR
ncbi:hypothetical protein E4K72_04585 [Oxalobacteraceae bacterium OM1]|nr:hypothetical protein E4K72_04585 [Oxalobacteraceae bacterium OM1]